MLLPGIRHQHLMEGRLKALYCKIALVCRRSNFGRMAVTMVFLHRQQHRMSVGEGRQDS